MQEAKIEKYFRTNAKSHGGVTFKTMSPGIGGFPDRIYIHNSQVYFIEFKQSKGELSPKQLFIRRKIEINGGLYFVLNDIEAIDDFFKQINYKRA